MKKIKTQNDACVVVMRATHWCHSIRLDGAL